jgi:hypothetical protein
MSARSRGARRAPAILAAVIATLAALASRAHAHIVSDRDVALIKSVPAQRMAMLLAGSEPDAAGRVGENRGAWRAVEPQAAAGFRIADAATRADSARCEIAWRSLDAAFEQQTPRGDFLRAEPTDVLTARVGVTRWMGESCRALVAVMNSPLQERFRWRHTLMLPKVRRTLDWLVAGADSVQTQLQAAQDAPALLSQARCFLLADGMFHEEVFGRAGQRAIQSALAMQATDGTFHSPTPGAEAQAASVWALQSVVEYFPSPSLEAALQKGAKALAAQVGSDGKVMGVSDLAAARRVALTLTMYAAYSGDAATAKVAERATLASSAVPKVLRRQPPPLPLKK